MKSIDPQELAQILDSENPPLLDIDRTRWNSRYGSSRFFKALGKHLVNDHISLQIQLFA